MSGRYVDCPEQLTTLKLWAWRPIPAFELSENMLLKRRMVGDNGKKSSRSGVTNLLKRVQQKEKSKLRGPHPGNTFIYIKSTIYNTKSINVKLDAASAH